MAFELYFPTFLMLVIILVVGLLIYYFYRKRQGEQENMAADNHNQPITVNGLGTGHGADNEQEHQPGGTQNPDYNNELPNHVAVYGQPQEYISGQSPLTGVVIHSEERPGSSGSGDHRGIYANPNQPHHYYPPPPAQAYGHSGVPGYQQQQQPPTQQHQANYQHPDQPPSAFSSSEGDPGG